MLLSELLEERGWSNEDAAAYLNEQGVTVRERDGAERPVSAKDVSGRKPRKLTKAWAAALGIESPPPSAESGGGPGAEQGRRRNEASPVRPPGAAIVVEAGAKDRIAGAYRFVGGMLGTGVAQTRGVQVGNGVAAVWTDSADKIAECWIKAAETNPWAARFVAAMNAGGPVGDLVGVHLYLAGGTAYVLGAGLPDAVFAKYSRYRTVDAKPSTNGAAAAGEGAVEPTADPVG